MIKLLMGLAITVMTVWITQWFRSRERREDREYREQDRPRRKPKPEPEKVYDHKWPEDEE